jgi:hypothetical protein
VAIASVLDFIVVLTLASILSQGSGFSTRN